MNTPNSRKIELITLKAKYQIITVLFLDEDILFPICRSWIKNQRKCDLCNLIYSYSLILLLFAIFNMKSEWPKKPILFLVQYKLKLNYPSLLLNKPFCWLGAFSFLASHRTKLLRLRLVGKRTLLASVCREPDSGLLFELLKALRKSSFVRSLLLLTLNRDSLSRLPASLRSSL